MRLILALFLLISPTLAHADPISTALVAIAGPAFAGTATAIAGQVYFAIAALALNALTSALSGKPKVPGERQQQLIQNTLDPLASRQIVYGKVRKGGTIVFRGVSQNRKRLHLVIALAGHQCEAIEEIFFNEDLAFDAAGTVQKKFKTKAFVTKHLGDANQLADPDLVTRIPEWTADHRLRGITYIHVQLLFSVNKFPSVPVISAIVKGKNDIFDPRDLQTKWTDNPALIVADYLHDATYGLKAAYTTEIDDDELSAAANVCDELVNIPDGEGGETTEKRYTCNGVVDSADEPERNIERLLSSMYGLLPYSGGKWIVKAGAFDTPAITLDENDLRGNLKVQARVEKRELFNAIRGTFISPKNKYQPADFPPRISATFEAQDNGERIWRDIELPYTDSETMAQRLAKIHLFAMREQIQLSYPCSLKALRLRAGDNVRITNTRMGWTEKIFQVVNWRFAVNDEGDAPVLGTELALRETSLAVFDSTAGEQELLDAAPDTDLPPPDDVEAWSVTVDGKGNATPTSVFANFEAIRDAEQWPVWPGTIVGFVRNPITGHLNIQDQNLANANDQAVFDNYVGTPVLAASYESPEIAIAFDDEARSFASVTAEKGPGEPGTFKRSIEYDFRKDADPYDGFAPLDISSDEAKFFKFKTVFDLSGGAGPILKRFRPVISKRQIVEKKVGVNVPVGGRDFVFADPYHNLPEVSVTSLDEEVRSIVVTELTGDGFHAAAGDVAGVDVGGNISYRAEGV